MPRVLVVEDEADIAFGLEVALGYEGYEVEVATNAAAALRRGTDEGFELILLDVMLPGQNGFEICRELRRSGVQTPIIFLTARANEGDRISGLELGANDYITKPFSTRELVARMRAVLRGVNGAKQDRVQLAREMEAAARVQQRLLPRVEPTIAGADIAGICRPARGVSGDYFDFIELPAEAVGIVVADVSGKGMPAALLAASVHAAVRAYAPPSGSRCGELIAAVNRQLYDTTSEDRFVTMFYAVFDPHERTLTFANAGHCPAFVVQAKDTVRLDSLTPPVGMLATIPAVDQTVQLEAGDRVVIVSDGILEAGEAEFGDARLQQVLQTHRSASSRQLCELVLDAVKAHAGGRPRSDDDQTIVSIRL